MEKLGPDHEPALPVEFAPKTGQNITIQRTDGEIESGWIVFSFNLDQDTIFIRKEDQVNGPMEKRPKISEIERFNRQAKLEDISSSKNFQQLEFTLNRLKTISGSNQNYTSEDLIERINFVVKNEGSIKVITRTAGLRNTVERLLKETTETK